MAAAAPRMAMRQCWLVKVFLGIRRYGMGIEAWSRTARVAPDITHNKDVLEISTLRVDISR
jgi:hypothetical protein